MLHTECRQCQPTCKDLRENTTSCVETEGCIEACVCPDDFYEYNGGCYKDEDCPCYYMGQPLFPGDIVSEGACQTWCVPKITNSISTLDETIRGKMFARGWLIGCWLN